MVETPLVSLTPAKPCEPERKLLAAILHHAVSDLFAKRPNHPTCVREWAEDRKSAQAFIFDAGTAFDHLCGQLGLDPSTIRAGIVARAHAAGLHIPR